MTDRREGNSQLLILEKNRGGKRGEENTSVICFPVCHCNTDNLNTSRRETESERGKEGNRGREDWEAERVKLCTDPLPPRRTPRVVKSICFKVGKALKLRVHNDEKNTSVTVKCEWGLCVNRQLLVPKLLNMPLTPGLKRLTVKRLNPLETALKHSSPVCTYKRALYSTESGIHTWTMCIHVNTSSPIQLLQTLSHLC